MAAPDALLSSASSRWRTPVWFLELVRRVGPIVLDPASTADNPTGALAWYTPAQNGLRLPWPVSGLVFVNPPYGVHLSGPVDPWRLVVKKSTVLGFGSGWAARMAQHAGEGLYLVPCRRETDWWRSLNEWCDWRCEWASPARGARINFVLDPSDPVPEKKNGSTFASTVFYRGPNIARFFTAFELHGEMEPGARTLRTLIAHATRAGWRP